MNLRFSGLCLAVLGVMGGLVAPSAAQAGVIGEYFQGSLCGATENLSIPVAAAGHTWVKVNALDASSLSGLDGLYIRSCGAYAGNAAVNSAVSAGMALMVDVYAHDVPNYQVDGPVMPGAPAFSFVFASGGCESNYSLATGAPIASGPGGTLTNDSLDVGAPGGANGSCTFLGGKSVASLPAGVVPFFTAQNGLNATAVGYGYGAGRVVVSSSALSHGNVYAPSEYSYAGAKAFFINGMAWALNGNEVAQTCASEGYTGTKLTWCQNICEKGYTGATLNSWIKRWTDKYRDLPYCAR